MNIEKNISEFKTIIYYLIIFKFYIKSYYHYIKIQKQTD